MIRFVTMLASLALFFILGCKSRHSDGEGELEKELPEAQPQLMLAAEDAGGGQGAQEGVTNAKNNSYTQDSMAAGNLSTSNRSVLAESNTLVREVQAQRRTLSTAEANNAISSIRDARNIVAGRGKTSDILCFPSSSKPGKSCMKLVRGDNSCLGNYFDAIALCKESLRTAKNGRACFQSSSNPGKGLISLYGKDHVTSLIGNYYSSYTNCLNAMQDSYGYLVCMESVRKIGKWFIADLDQNGAQIGGYFDSYRACQQSF